MIASINGFMESLPHISGFLFVVFVLTILWIAIAGLGTVFVRLDNKKTANLNAAKVNEAVVPSASTDEVPEEDIVIIASTVAMLLGQKRHRLVSIRHAGTGWGQEGRRQHVMSHKIN